MSLRSQNMSWIENKLVFCKLSIFVSKLMKKSQKQMIKKRNLLNLIWNTNHLNSKHIASHKLLS